MVFHYYGNLNVKKCNDFSYYTCLKAANSTLIKVRLKRDSGVFLVCSFSSLTVKNIDLLLTGFFNFMMKIT